jgi:hypothetical protein
MLRRFEQQIDLPQHDKGHTITSRHNAWMDHTR